MLIHVGSLNMGFGPPEAKIKRCNQKSTTQTGGGSLGLAGLLPGLNMNAARTRGVSQTMEIADEDVCVTNEVDASG
jgi:hypothetical protein